MRRFRLVIFVFVSLLLAAAARAQAVRWETADDPGDLVLSFENCSPDGDPQLPAVSGVQFSLTGRGSRTEMNNFNVTSYVQLTYRLRARASAPVSIPAFDVKTSKGTLRVPAFTSGAVRATVLDGTASSRFMPANATLWAGEVFPLTYTLDVARRNFSGSISNLDWDASSLVAEEWSKPEPAEVIVSGEARAYIVYKTRAYAKTPGLLSVGSVKQATGIQTGSIGFGLFQTPRVEQLNLESNRPQLAVRELPPAPPGFSGAVGQFTLVSKIVPEKAAVGEPVTWTVELGGTGNWPDIAGLPSREVSSDFQVVQPKAKRTPAEGKLFDATLAEDVVLVPTKPGNYTLGPLAFVYFDPRTGTYKTLSAPPTLLTIIAPNAPKLFNVAPSAGEPATPAPETAEKPLPPPVTPAAPAGIPRDPLPGAALARTPLSADTLVLCLLSPVFCLLLFWLWLALDRALRTDPARPRREARARVAAVLAEMRASAASHAQLLRWQHATAALWQITHAAPPATALGDPVWATLWAESDRALYGAKTALPSDWIARAEAALAAKRVPGFNPLGLFLPRNLLPFAALVLFALLLPSTLHADEATAAYRRGDFATAEKSWRAALAQTPTDWIARHNLSLALAQQDRAGEAAAQATAAFVQNPADPSVRWHFTLACEKAGFAPPPLAAFLSPDPWHLLARSASPSDWQVALIAAAALAALALGGLLYNSYRWRSRVASWCAGFTLALAVALAAVALAATLTYGLAANDQAVIAWRAGTLRSIPTEADVTQKTTPLLAGSVALADKTFLDWTRLVFDNGQTGWVRKDELVPLWRGPK